jgi:hypothetical protein
MTKKISTPIHRAKNARISVDRIQTVVHHFQSGPASRPIHRALMKAVGRLAGSGWLPPARMTGRSIMPNATVADCVSERQSPKRRRTVSSTGE